MKKKFYGIIAAVICAITVCLTFCVNASAQNEVTAESFGISDSRVICVAHRGDSQSFPENSAQAIRAAAAYDAISVDIGITKDAKVVLFADDTIDRMCCDADGGSVSGNISDKTLGELKELYLREGNGSADKAKTDCKIATLEEGAQNAGEAVLMLNLTADELEPVLREVERLQITDRVVLRFDEKSNTVIDLKSKGNLPQIIGNYQGNIIFLATNAVKKCFRAGIYTVELGSTNGHGVLYDNFMMKRFAGKGRAMVSMVGGRCGKRTDNETGWDNLISLGYSVIETDYSKQLTEYIENLDGARSELQRCLDIYGDVELSAYTTESEENFKNAVSQSEEALNGLCSLSEANDARYNLQSGYNALTVGAKKAVTLQFNFTIGRMVTVVLCAAAFIASQIYLYKKRIKK